MQSGRRNGKQWSSSIPPIGRPIANAKAYILDDNLNLVPIGVRGQLCLGGQGIARGYFGKPGLTAEKFVPDHLSGGAGERLYLTGDMCRYLADGNIQFLGRIDHQVKFLGHRIELQGIRALLNDFPAIEDSVVLVLNRHPRQSTAGCILPRVAAARSGRVARVAQKELSGRNNPRSLHPPKGDAVNGQRQDRSFSITVD